MTVLSVANHIEQMLRPYAEAVNTATETVLSDQASAGVPATLIEAMRYASLNGGKRLRPALVMLSAEAVADSNSWPVDPIPAAVAVELVHCYSLVHDDLPAMDDDTLRRGKPTCHVQFGEAMAILTGDALLTRAFEVISRDVADPYISVRLICELAAAAGPEGMIAGQVADMGLCEVPQGAAGRKYIHLRKTAALLRGAVRMGGICAGADEQTLDALGRFGVNIGLAFQIADDLLDAVGSARTIGKTPGKDARSGKRTYAGELGADRTRRLVAELTAQANSILETFGQRAEKLRELTDLLARRDR